MKDILLIYNPKAGDTTFRFSLDRFIEIFSAKNWEIRVFRCSNVGSAAAYLSETDLSSTQAIFAAGGSGTINEIVGAMILRGVKLPLGIIPAGTQNEVARKLGFSNDLEQNLKALSKMETIKVNVASCMDRFFVDEISAGTVAALTHTSPEMKNTFGTLANYMMSVTAIKKLRKMKLQIESGEKRYTGKFQYFAVINTDLRKDPRKNSGMFTLIASKKASYGVENKYLYDEAEENGVINNKALRIVGSEFSVIPGEEEGHIVTQVDGDLGPSLPLEIKVLHEALEVVYDAEGLEKRLARKNRGKKIEEANDEIKEEILSESDDSEDESIETESETKQ